MSFIPGKDSTSEINISSTHGSSTIYIGDEFNLSVVSFKGFIESLSYDLSKDSEAETSKETGSTIFTAKNGLCSIKIAFNVVASSVFEAKSNLAKISHLQISTRMQKSSGALDGDKNRLIVYLSNLINNGYADSFIKVDKDTIYANLRKVGFMCAIDEVKYEPDTSFGFLSDSRGLYPKAFSVNLTLNPDMNIDQVSAQKRVFMKPFNSNGHYNRSDFAFFPFLVKVGAMNYESGDFSTYCNSFDYESMSDLNSQELLSSRGNSKIFISMPIDPTDFKVSETNARHASTDFTTEVPRFLVFEPFLESFSRTFKTKTDMYKDPNGLLDQKIQGRATSQAVEYSFSFTAPAQSLSQAKRNAAKMQYLMRMFFKKKDTSASGLDDKHLNSLKMFIRGVMEKGVAGDTYTNTNDIEELYSRAMYLQVSGLTIDVDVKTGFFVSGGKFYPKAYKISIDAIDSYQENYLKQQPDGAYENVQVEIPILLENGKERKDKEGNVLTKLKDVFTGTPQDNGNRQISMARRVYWTPGG
jgi:hypothetical protein